MRATLNPRGRPRLAGNRSPEGRTTRSGEIGEGYQPPGHGIRNAGQRHVRNGALQHQVSQRRNRHGACLDGVRGSFERGMLTGSYSHSEFRTSFQGAFWGNVTRGDELRPHPLLVPELPHRRPAPSRIRTSREARQNRGWGVASAFARVDGVIDST